MNQQKYPHIRALIVDDNGFARSVGRRILQTAGLENILDAASGQQAIDCIQQSPTPIDVVFCDLMMPDMDGVQFLRHAASLPAKPAFVFVSGADALLLGTAENTARARGLRVLGSIQKPFTLDAARRILALLTEETVGGAGAQRSAYSITPGDLKTALADNQILLHFQPKSSIESGALVGFESLARWRHPEHGLIPPTTFISEAERCGMIAELTDRTMALALNQCAAWAAIGLNKKVSVNLSAHMLVDITLPERLARDADQFGIDPHQLILEITESGVFKDVANTLEILARLHMKGFPLSIDDFGTGYSSLEQLSRVPFTEMKIDRAFVRGVAENARALVILETSVNLGRKLGMTVVAEGAETEEDWDILNKVGVDLVQGYFIAKPMGGERVPAWSAAWEQRMA